MSVDVSHSQPQPQPQPQPPLFTVPHVHPPTCRSTWRRALCSRKETWTAGCCWRCTRWRKRSTKARPTYKNAIQVCRKRPHEGREQGCVWSGRPRPRPRPRLGGAFGAAAVGAAAAGLGVARVRAVGAAGGRGSGVCVWSCETGWLVCPVPNVPYALGLEGGGDGEAAQQGMPKEAFVGLLGMSVPKDRKNGTKHNQRKDHPIAIFSDHSFYPRLAFDGLPQPRAPPPQNQTPKKQRKTTLFTQRTRVPKSKIQNRSPGRQQLRASFPQKRAREIDRGLGWLYSISGMGALSVVLGSASTYSAGGSSLATQFGPSTFPCFANSS